MARYKLMAKFMDDPEEVEVLGQRKLTKADVNRWCDDNINALGLDWRVGYRLKFCQCDAVYRWVWIKDGRDLKAKDEV